jgi:mannose-6-phosphate isomerase-like protein (cupin superfamily)
VTWGWGVTTPRDGEFLAPDGIIIRPIAGAGSALTSVVVGIIPPRETDYPVHLHYGLEQVTVVLSGQVTALQRGPSDPHHSEIELGPGEAITTPPASTLSFRNHGTSDAEVLFICVPAYPPTNADTEVLSGGHRPLTVQELRRSAERLKRAQEYIGAQIEARVNAMRWLAHADESDEHRI